MGDGGGQMCTLVYSNSGYPIVYWIVLTNPYDVNPTLIFSHGIGPELKSETQTWWVLHFIIMTTVKMMYRFVTFTSVNTFYPRQLMSPKTSFTKINFNEHWQATTTNTIRAYFHGSVYRRILRFWSPLLIIPLLCKRTISVLAV